MIMEVQSKPFSCPMEDCSMTFANEDHLVVHKQKHELTLTLTPTSFKNPFVDQTPTPTRFLNALEPELFQEFPNDNPFDATFRKANSGSSTSHNFLIPESSSLIGNLPDTSVLNTPSIILPSEPDTPLALKNAFRKKQAQIQQDGHTYSENTDTLPFTPNEQAYQDDESQRIVSSEDISEENAANISLLSDSSNQSSIQKSNLTRTSVVQTPVITSVGNSTVLKSNTTGVPTAVVVTRQPTNSVSSLTSSQVSVVTEQPSSIKVTEQAQSIVQSVCVTPMVQVMIRLPDGQTMPVQFPVMTSATAPPPPTQPAQTVASIVPQVTTSNSVAKMKLKEVITMNQKTGSISKKHHNGKVKTKQPVQLLPVQDSLYGYGLSLSPPLSPVATSRTSHNGRKRRELSDDADEKRRRSLERNRAAATRCREKRKQWITALEQKADELANTNTQLQNEVAQLRNEVAHLKTMLLAHKDCPVTLQQRASCGFEADKQYTVHIITNSEELQRVPNSAAVSPLKEEFLEMEINSVQSSSDASIASDTSEMSYRER